MNKFITNIFIFFLLLAFLTSISGCKKEDRIPIVNFYHQVNLTDASSGDIRIPGNYLYIDATYAGYGGVVLYCLYHNEYIAYDRNCTHKPFNSNAILDVDSTGLFLVCRDCASKFRIHDGLPISGPAKYSLVKYNTQLNDPILYIYN
jgi:nitrite reductase/ring-hydroxylating ferredoxin subunit